MGMDKWDPEIWARANFAVLLMFNMGTICIWIRSAFLGRVFLPVFLCVFTFLFFYYNKSRFQKIEERYKNEPPRQKFWGNVAVISYAVVSVVLFFYPLIKAMKPID